MNGAHGDGETPTRRRAEAAPDARQVLAPSGSASPSIATAPVPRTRLLEYGCSVLRVAGIDSPRREARLLLAHALGIDMADLLRNPNQAAAAVDYEALLVRRAAREPLAYILGSREFWSLDFIVSPATLIPRPESETLIEAAVAAFAGRTPPRRILDLGTGSGCLLLAALHEFPLALGVGVDRSLAAVRIAAANADGLGRADRAMFLCADWSGALRGTFDLVLCNPPYIATSALEGLMPEVGRHEPVTALDGGADGLAAYRHVLATLRCTLPPDGVAVLELGIGQGGAVAALAAQCGLIATTRRDLAGIARAMVLTRNGP